MIETTGTVERQRSEPPFQAAMSLGPAAPAAQTLRLALMESRQRWRQFGALAADLMFETDAEGQLTFLAPDTVLGWPGADLVGETARSLLADPNGADPFQSGGPMHRRRVWLRTKDGAQQCMALSAVPMLDDAGRPRGLRGVGVNVTEQDRSQAATAAALRRGDLLDHILARMRQEVLAPRMMRAVLDTVAPALGCSGAAVLDLLQTAPPLVLHTAGTPPPSDIDTIMPSLVSGDDATSTALLPDGTQVLACPCSTRFGDRAALIAWRGPGDRGWSEEDLLMAGSVAGVVRIVMEHEAIQRELARQARTDPLTGLLNRRAFIDETARRLDRLESDGLPGTLLFLDLDRLKQLNDRAGHEAGDSAILLMASLLQRTFRPQDLVARLGGDEFAVWLDGADSFTAAERAEALRLATPDELAHLCAGQPDPMSVSIGIATREPGAGETLDQLIHRADQAMYQVKRHGRGHWHVSQPAAAQ